MISKRTVYRFDKNTIFQSRKVILVFLICFISVFFAFKLQAQTMYNESVIMLPREVFLGDDLEIRYTFSTNVELIDKNVNVVSIKFPEIETCTIKSIELTGQNGNYILSVKCIPWIIGSLDIPPIDIEPFSTAISVPFILDIPPVTIYSLVDKTQKTELRPVRPPLVIPGTTWLLYGIILLCLIVFIVLLIILVRIKKLRAKCSNFFEKVFSSRNYRHTIKALKRLLKKEKNFSSIDFAKQISEIIRKYLTYRFSHNFDAETTSAIISVFNEILGYTAETEQLLKMEFLVSILVRCDFVRFSGSTREEGSISTEERREIIQQLFIIFAQFEKGDDYATV